MCDAALLTKAFEAFHETSAQLEAAYRKLEKRASRLRHELDRKDRVLRETMTEKEAAQFSLKKILENLSTGVIIVDGEGTVLLANREAETLAGKALPGLRTGEWAAALGLTALTGSDASRPASLLDKLHDQTLLLPGPGRRSIHIDATVLKSATVEGLGGILLLQDVTRIRQLEQRAERKSRLTAMGEMSAQVAHEIRNPLGSIELFASILRKELVQHPDCRDLAGRILTGVRSLNHMVGNLLHYTRAVRPSCRPVSVRGVLEESLQFAEQALQQKGIRCSGRHEGEDVATFTDGELLKQVFMNLMLNAAQAMPDGGRLDVSSVVGKGEVAYRFADTGEGIAEEDLPRIFTPFFSGRKKGTGLGLAIVQNIVDTLGGRIEVQSGPGAGTVFTVVFPLDVPEGMAARVAAAR